MMNEPSFPSRDMHSCPLCGHRLKGPVSKVCPQCHFHFEKSFYVPFWLAKIDFTLKDIEDELRLARRLKSLFSCWPRSTRAEKKHIRQEVLLMADLWVRYSGHQSPFFWQKKFDSWEIDSEHVLASIFFERQLSHFQSDQILLKMLRGQRKLLLTALTFFFATILFAIDWRLLATIFE